MALGDSFEGTLYSFLVPIVGAPSPALDECRSGVP